MTDDDKNLEIAGLKAKNAVLMAAGKAMQDALNTIKVRIGDDLEKLKGDEKAQGREMGAGSCVGHNTQHAHRAATTA